MSKIALITGGSRGLGKNAALKIAKKGDSVVLTYHTQEADARQVVAEIESAGGQADALRLDVGDLASFPGFADSLSKVLKEKWGVDKFDYLVNNVGMGATIPFMQATEADFDRFIDVHFKGVFFLTQKLVPMINDRGRIVNLSSGSTRFHVPGYAIYASAKSAVETLTRYLAKELGPRGITVNILAPGAIETDFNNAAIRSNPQMKGFLASQTALGRVGEAEDIGKLVAFLCSDDSFWINGQRIEASGGVNL